MRRQLLPLYATLHRAIRQHDKESIIFYEPHVLNGQLGVPSDFPAGGPGGESYNDRQAFAYHIYCQVQSPSFFRLPSFAFLRMPSPSLSRLITSFPIFRHPSLPERDGLRACAAPVRHGAAHRLEQHGALKAHRRRAHAHRVRRGLRLRQASYLLASSPLPCLLSCWS